jgi:hypothetical protein
VKHLIIFIVALLFVNPASAKSTQFALNSNFEVFIDKSRSQLLRKNSSYNYTASSRNESVGLVQKFQLTTHLFAGLGLWIGGPEIEIETTASISRHEEFEIDLNRWIGVRAKIDFADLVPFGNLAYRFESRDAQLQINANAGLKLLLPSRVSLDFNGEFGDLVNRETGLVAQLERDSLNQLENYYLVPVFDIGLRYAFN